MVVWAGLVMVACCVGHTVLLAGGFAVLAGAAGGLTGAPVLIAVAGLVLLAALVLGVRRLRAARTHTTGTNPGNTHDPGTSASPDITHERGTGDAGCCQGRKR